MKMDRQDFSYDANKYGYMVKYKEHNIGGAGVKGRPKMHWRHAQANVKDNIRYAEMEIQNLLEGRGRLDMRRLIEKIDSEEIQNDRQNRHTDKQAG